MLFILHIYTQREVWIDVILTTKRWKTNNMLDSQLHSMLLHLPPLHTSSHQLPCSGLQKWLFCDCSLIFLCFFGSRSTQTHFKPLEYLYFGDLSPSFLAILYESDCKRRFGYVWVVRSNCQLRQLPKTHPKTISSYDSVCSSIMILLALLEHHRHVLNVIMASMGSPHKTFESLSSRIFFSLFLVVARSTHDLHSLKLHSGSKLVVI